MAFLPWPGSPKVFWPPACPLKGPCIPRVPGGERGAVAAHPEAPSSHSRAQGSHSAPGTVLLPFLALAYVRGPGSLSSVVVVQRLVLPPAGAQPGDLRLPGAPVFSRIYCVLLCRCQLCDVASVGRRWLQGPVPESRRKCKLTSYTKKLFSKVHGCAERLQSSPGVGGGGQEPRGRAWTSRPGSAASPGCG